MDIVSFWVQTKYQKPENTVNRKYMLWYRLNTKSKGSKIGHWTISNVSESGSSFMGTITQDIGQGKDTPERHARSKRPRSLSDL